MTIDEKLIIVGEEYDIPVEVDLRKDVSIMCNLSQGIKEDGIKIGRAEGIMEGRAESEERIIVNMYQNGLTPEQIAIYTNTALDNVLTIIDKALIAGS